MGCDTRKKAQLVAVYSPLKVEKIMLELFQPFVRFLYFKEGFSDEMREAIALCFEDYLVFAKDHLTWLWQGEPPQGESTSNTFDKVKPIRKILKNYTQMKELSLLYTSGIEKFATGAWEFLLVVVANGKLKKKNYQSTLTFSMPIDWVGENSKAFIDLFIKCAQRLKSQAWLCWVCMYYFSN